MNSRRNGYYDPGLEAVLPAAVPVAREAYAGARRVGGRVWQAQRRFARSQNVALGLKLALVAGLWAVGMYLIYVFQKSGVKDVFEHFDLPLLGPQALIPVWGYWSLVTGGMTYITDHVLKIKKEATNTTPEAEKALADFFEQMKTYIIVWSIICALIAVYVYYQHRQEQAQYV